MINDSKLKRRYGTNVSKSTAEHGRIALVTGAARGRQGLAITHQFLADGFKVVACDCTDDLADAAGAGARAVSVDVTVEADWSRAIEAALELGGLDVLVNNAGILRRTAIGDETAAEFRNTWEVNCLGPFLGIQVSLPLLLQSTSAVIVNTCSTSALKGFPLHVSYCASKWALRGLTQSLAAELGPQGIRVNAVMPGPIATLMLSPEATRRLHAEGTALGKPEDIARAVAFLASSEASFVSGAEFVVDGGQMAAI